MALSDFKTYFKSDGLTVTLRLADIGAAEVVMVNGLRGIKAIVQGQEILLQTTPEQFLTDIGAA